MTIALPPLDLSTAKILPLVEANALQGFCCGEKQIDDWVPKCRGLQKQHRARVFCAFAGGHHRAYGFYSLSMIGVDPKGLDPEITRHHNVGGAVPFLYIDYLAVEHEFQNQGLGTILLINALQRCADIARNVALFGVALNSLTERTTNLYEKHGFGVKRALQHPLMVLPVFTLFDLFPSR